PYPRPTFGNVDNASSTRVASGDRDAIPNTYIAARTPLEKHLAKIWQDLLRVTQVGVGDSFFDLGGHSLLAERMLARVYAELGADLPLPLLFEAPTLGELAERILENQLEQLPPEAIADLLGTEG
ncbi:MAG: phosphopantetheine-binding protein, partial [Polyangiaceae bacterium]